MARAIALFAGFAIVLAAVLYFQLDEAGSTAPDDDTVVVYLTPECGCCAVWADYMVEEGFDVEVHELQSLAEIRAEKGVPPFLGSCHTAVVGGYVVEGHVPAEDVRRMLEQQPDAAGITVPGMPIGSPGMEIPGREPDSYQVYLFREDGSRAIFAQH